MKLTPELILGFSGTILSPKYDNPAPTPKCHMEWWEMCCSDYPWVSIAAPRGHAKSTAVTHAYTLASLLFRDRNFCLLVSDTYEQSVMFLGDIKSELQNNETLIETFGVEGFEKDSENDIIVRLNDGHRFRVLSKGAEQKIRGLKWDGMRPDLIICDDIENDEAVQSKERREKFRSWFLGALLPARSRNGKVRMVGTVLHLDSLLERTLPGDHDKGIMVTPVKTATMTPRSGWMSARYKAHSPDFKHILWPDMWPEEALKRERAHRVAQGMPEVYAREFLNYPIDDSTSYFRSEDFLSMDQEDHNRHKIYYAAADLAVTKGSRSDWTAIVIGGVDQFGILHIVDRIKGRYDAEEIVELLMQLHVRYHPDLFTMEKGLIEKSIGPFLKRAMIEKGIYINLNPMNPANDKEMRARSIQGRMRAGQVKFDTKASWFYDLQQEMVQFPRGRHDDQVDAMSWLGLTLNKITEAPTLRELAEEEYEEELMESGIYGLGRSYATGY